MNQTRNGLIFTPNNALFKTVMDQVAAQMHLDEVKGVDDSTQLQNFTSKDFIAGIEFHHSNVRLFVN